MDIILLRHGQAEPIPENGADADRRLTGAGRRAMRAALMRAWNLLPSGKKIVIWTSPLIRARETADIAASCLRKSFGKKGLAGLSVDVRDELAELTPESAAEALAVSLGFQSDEQTAFPEDPDFSDSDLVLILVGHDPQISRLAAFFTGREFRFKKGAVMCVRLGEAVAERVRHAFSLSEALGALCSAGQLQWFIQGPSFQRWEMLGKLETLLADGFSHVMNESGRFEENAEEADSVHDLRVAVRTLRSYVSFLEPFQEKKQNRHMQRDLRAALGQLSLLREYDVLLNEAKRVDVELVPALDGFLTAESQGVPEVPEKLDAVLSGRREKECRRILKKLSGSRFSEELRSLDKEFRQIRWRSEVERDGLGKRELSERLDELRDALLDACHELDLTDADAVHTVRKQTKEVRYAASGLKPLIGTDPDFSGDMKQIQERLGALCDARVNIQMLAKLQKEKGQLSEITIWQTENLIARERADEKILMEELAVSLCQAEY